MGIPLGVIAFVLFSISLPIGISYLLDRRVHEGVDWFKRRRVLSQGVRAPATVLSSTLLVDRSTGSKLSAAYSIVYEVRPENVPGFRARAIEVMYFSEARANQLNAGQVVDVRFDPSDQTVVLVRVDTKRVRLDRDAERKAKEDALLRGR